MFRTLSSRLAALLSVAALTLSPSLLQAQKALVYCPVGIDATGCNAIVAALAADAARFPGGADAGYDGTQGTVDLASVDLAVYAVFVVPSLADGAGVQPYALLRNSTIAGRLKAAFMGRSAVWSGTPDVGSTNRATKDELIRNLAAWARSDSAGTHGPGVVALQDNSDDAATRYGWVSSISGISVTADTTLNVYSNVQALTQTATTILTGSDGLQIGYTNMASFALIPGTGVNSDATGGRTSAVVLATVAGEPSNPNIATVSTDKEDYFPPDTVTVTGAGWDPGETVSLLFHELVTPPIHPDVTYTATADAAGHILNHEFVVDSADIGVRFALTATGQTSAKTAQTTFTDNKNVTVAKAGTGTGTVTNSQPLPANQINCGATCTASFGNNDQVTLNAAPSAGSTIGGWSVPAGYVVNSGCGATSTSCQFTMNNTSQTVTVTFNGAATTTVLASSQNPSVFGQSITLTATVTVTAGGSPATSGSVTFIEGGTCASPGTTLGGPTAVNPSGIATLTTSALSVAAHAVMACFGGGGGFAASSGGTTQTVNKANTTTALSSSANPSTFGQSVTFTAAVSAIAPGSGTRTGTVQFQIDGSNFGSPVSLTAGSATSGAISSLTVGSHPVAAVYSGDGSFNGSTSTVIATQTVNQATSTTTLTSSANPSVFGQSVTLTATVKNGATPITVGNIAFIEGGTCTTPGTTLQANQTPNGSGVVTYTSAAFSVAGHSVIACYDGSGAFGPSQAPLTQTVNKAATTTTISSDTPDPSTIGQPVTVNYAVAVTAPGAGTPTGNVTVSDGTDSCTGTVAAGTCSITLNTAGARTLTATYAGDGNFNTSTSAGAAHTVNLTATSTAVTSSLNPSTFGVSVTFTATVTSGVNPVTVGNVTFIEGGTCAAPTTTLQAAQAVNGSGQVTFATAALGVGSHTVVGCYGASGSFAASNGNVVQTVNVAPTTLTVASATGTFGGTAALSATLTRTADGPISGRTVSFTLNGSPAGSATTNASGVASIAAASLSGINAGSYPTGVGASFAGDASFATSSGTGALTVNQATVTVTVTVIPTSITYGGLVELDADLSPGLSGRTISFSIDGTPVGTMNTNGSGKAKLMNVNPATAGISAGSHTVTATFPAETNYATASGTGSLTITQAASTTAVTSSLNPSTFGQAVTFTATVSSAGGTPTGSATFIEGGTCAAPTTTLQTATALDGTGKVTFSSSTLTAVSHTVVACFLGSTNFAASNGNVVQTVNKATPTVTWANPADITYGTALSATQLNATASVPGSFVYTPAAGTVLPAGNGQTLSVSFTPTDATNYNGVPSTTVIINVLKLSVTPHVTANNKPYDGTTAAIIATRTLTGVFGTDDVTLTGGTATFDTKNAGTGKTVTVTGLTLGGTAAANYVLSSTTATTTADITPRALAVTATGQNKEYDGTTAATVTLADDRVSGDVFTTSYASATFADKNVGTGKTVTVSGISISGTDAGNYTANTTATTTANITARALTVTADAKTKVYGDIDPPFTYQLTTGTLVAGDAFSGALTRAPGQSVAGSPYAIQQGTLTAGPNYLITFVGANLSITARPLTVTATGVNKVYDGTTAATVTLSDNRISGDVFTVSYAAATFADKHVGTSKPISVTGISVAGADAGNYSLASTTASATADITAASVTGAVTVADKVYDATAAATISTRSLTGTIGSDDVSLSGGTATFADKHVGAGKTVTVTGLTLSGADAGNYLLSSTTATTTASITPASVTPHVTADNKVYDGTATATIATATLTGVISGDAVTLTVGSAAFDTKHVGTGKTVTASGLSLTGADAGNYQLSAATATTTADITALAITGTITAADKIYDGTTAATIASRSLTGVIAPDVVTYTGGTATFADKHVGAAKTVTATGLSLTGADAGNYTVNGTATTTASITARALTVTATGQNKIYDGTATATVTLSDNRVSGDALTLAFTAASFSDKHVGNGKTVTVTGISVTGADAGNYTYNTTATTTADITARALVVTAAGVNRVYDATTAATVTLSDDRVAGDNISTSYASASFADKHVGTGKPVSVSGISISGPDAGNYTFNTTATTTADITARPITVAATGVNKIYDGNTSATVTLSSDEVAGDVVTASYSSATFADKHVGTAKPISVTGIAIAGADAGNYQLTSTTASATADITARALTVTAHGQNKVYDATAAATVTLTDDRVAGDVFTDSYASASFADKSVGTAKPVSVTGISISGADAGNYTHNTTASTSADITARTLTVTASAADKVYDGTTAATVTLSDDRVAGDVFSTTHSSATFSDKNVGAGKTVTVSGIAISGTDAGNYVLASTSATTTAGISARALVVSASAQNKVYDGTTTAAVTLSDDRVSGDVLTLAYATATFADKHVGNGKTVTVTGISVTGTDAGNYTYNATATATANITARPLVITAAGVNRVYDGTTIATVTLSDDRVAGDVFTDSYASASFADKHVGNGKPISVAGLSISGADAGNYTHNATTSTTADITPRALVVAAAGIDRTYDGTTAATVTLSDDRVAGDVFSTSYTAASFADKNVGTGKTVTVTGISISGADAGNYTFNATATTTASISARALVVTAAGSNKIYDGNTSATVTLSDDRVSGDVFTDSYASASFTDKNVGSGKSVAVSGISISGTDAGNYTFNSTASTTADITVRTLAVTATASDKVYDGTTAATAALADDRVAGDVFTSSYSSATFSDKNVGNGKTVTVSGISISGTDAGNYVLASTTITATAKITARALLVSAAGVSRVYDATTVATVTLSDDRVAGDVFTDSYASAAFANKNVGTAKPVSVSGISISGVDAGNYNANTTASTTADITQAPLAVTATGINRVYDATTVATVTLAATPIAGDAVTLNYASAAFADKNVGAGKTVSVSGINLTGTDGGNYAPNTTTSTTADITALGITGAITASNKVYDATTVAAILTRTLTGVISGDVVSYTGGTATFANKTVANGKTVTATGLGLTGADAGNYTVNSTATATANITALGITGAITASSKVYDATTAAAILTRTLTGVISGDGVTYTGGSATFNTKDVGTAKPVTGTGLSLAGADAGNYTVNTTAATTANVTAASSATVVTSSPVSLPYSDLGQSLPLAATVTSATVPGITEGAVVFTIKNALNVTVGSATAPVNVLGGTATATYAVPGMTDVGTYTIQAAFTGANFGAGSSGTGTLTVQPADFQATTATTDADFRSADDVDVLFKSDPKLSTLLLQNTNPGTLHYQLTYNNVTGVDINAANGATLKAIVEIPPMTTCGGVTCASSVDKTVAAWSLKAAKAVHVAPDDKTDDMAVQFSYKATGDCSVDAGYTANLSSIPAAAPKCIAVTGFAIPKLHRARLDLHLEFRWKASAGWAGAPDPKLYFYSGFAFKTTSIANFPNVVPSVRQSYQSAGIVAAGQRVTATGGFIFDPVSNPAADYHVRLFNLAADAAAANACAAGNPKVVSDAKVSADGFYFIWKTGYDQTNAAAPSLPSKIAYSVAVCDHSPTPATVATRTMANKMPDKEFSQEDFRLTTLIATGP